MAVKRQAAPARRKGASSRRPSSRTPVSRRAGAASARKAPAASARKVPARSARRVSASQPRRAPAAARSTGRRLGPRRLGPRKSASRIQWDRLGRICLTVVLAAICFSYFNPAINLVNSYKANSTTQQTLRELTAENARLEARTKALQDPVALSREARRQGMVLPGERPYVVRGLGS